MSQGRVKDLAPWFHRISPWIDLIRFLRISKNFSPQPYQTWSCQTCRFNQYLTEEQISFILQWLQWCWPWWTWWWYWQRWTCFVCFSPSPQCQTLLFRWHIGTDICSCQSWRAIVDCPTVEICGVSTVGYQLLLLILWGMKGLEISFGISCYMQSTSRTWGWWHWR